MTGLGILWRLAVILACTFMLAALFWRINEQDRTIADLQKRNEVLNRLCGQAPETQP